MLQSTAATSSSRSATSSTILGSVNTAAKEDEEPVPKQDEIRRLLAFANASTPVCNPCAEEMHLYAAQRLEYERKRFVQHNKDDKEKPVPEIQRLLALANEYVPVCKAATIEWTDSESSVSEEEPVAKQEQKRPRKSEKETNAKAPRR